LLSKPYKKLDLYTKCNCNSRGSTLKVRYINVIHFLYLNREKNNHSGRDVVTVREGIVVKARPRSVTAFEAVDVGELVWV